MSTAACALRDVIDINTFPLSDEIQQELPISDLVLSVRGEELWLESVSWESVSSRAADGLQFPPQRLPFSSCSATCSSRDCRQPDLRFGKAVPGLDFYPRWNTGT